MKTISNDVQVHDAVEEIPGLRLGPFTRLQDGRILAAEDEQAYLSSDNAATWEDFPLFPAGSGISIRPERALIRTRADVVILAFANEGERNWTWDNELKDAPGAVMPTYTVRSLDGGETWQDLQKLHDDWTGAIRDIIETRDGRVVFTTMKMLHDPGRHSVMTYFTADGGQTWTPSNIIDLGGMGHHGGVTESTIVELQNGRLLMYLRTNWSQFWWAYSDNGAETWHPMGPSGVDASMAPGLLERLESGRILLVWNRLYPEGKSSYPLSGGDGILSATPVSNHRGELSIAFSMDETKTWSDPVVIARKPNASLSYPYVFEAAPGELWITTMQGDLRLRLHEADFV